MNKIISFVAVLLAVTAGSASALQLGNSGAAFDNTVVAEYNINTSNYTVAYTANINYDVFDNVNIYAKTSVDITNITYTGVKIGAVWDINNNVNAYTNVSVDSAGRVGNAIIGVKFTF